MSIPSVQTSAFHIEYAPILSMPFLGWFIIITGILAVWSLLKYRKSVLPRLILACMFIILIMSPQLVIEKRNAVKDVVSVVIDTSPSQTLAQRQTIREDALYKVKQQIKNIDNIEIRIIEDTNDDARNLATETLLFKKLDQALTDVSPDRRAGAIFLTDGQVHDVPHTETQYQKYGPVHVLLTGKRNETDIKVTMLDSPVYGTVGETVQINYQIDYFGPNGTKPVSVPVTIKSDGQIVDKATVPVGIPQSTEIIIAHAGQNLVDIATPVTENELTGINNRVSTHINGIRNRLQVLLVSGQPHAGGRTWRNMLTSDPGVDLVHFTILRDPTKLDTTPQNELSLIAFPVQELFQVKLYDFDLIILDRYTLNNILPDFYFDNIVSYVKKGGALLAINGPSFATERSIYTTSLGSILPAAPLRRTIIDEFVPSLSDTGLRHPVTKDLSAQQNWGAWTRQSAVSKTSGNVLLSGIQDSPLLVLDHVEDGRIAQLTSDQIWLWARGYKGGGPHAELLRRLVHWLMKEPELEENALSLDIHGKTLTVTKRSLTDTTMSVTLTMPDNQTKTLTLTEDSPGILQAQYPLTTPGIYNVTDDLFEKFAVYGNQNTPEFNNVITTNSYFNDISKESGGGIFWLGNADTPSIKRVRASDRYAGKNWIGLPQNNAYTVTGITLKPAIPFWVYVIGLISLCLMAWRFESKN